MDTGSPVKPATAIPSVCTCRSPRQSGNEEPWGTQPPSDSTGAHYQPRATLWVPSPLSIQAQDAEKLIHVLPVEAFTHLERASSKHSGQAPHCGKLTHFVAESRCAPCCHCHRFACTVRLTQRRDGRKRACSAMRKRLPQQDSLPIRAMGSIAVGVLVTYAKVAVLAIPLVAISLWMISLSPGVTEDPKGTFSSILDTAWRSSTLHVVGRYRAAPRGSAGAVDPEARSIPVEIWVRECEVRVNIGESDEWFVYSPGHESKSQDVPEGLVFSSGNSYSRSSPNWFKAFSRWQYLFSIENCQSRNYQWEPEIREIADDLGNKVIRVTCSSGAKSTFSGGSAGVLSSMFDPGMTREYIVDPECSEVRAMKVYLGDTLDRTLLFETDEIEYRVPLDHEFIWAGVPAHSGSAPESRDFEDAGAVAETSQRPRLGPSVADCVGWEFVCPALRGALRFLQQPRATRIFRQTCHDLLIPSTAQPIAAHQPRVSRGLSPSRIQSAAFRPSSQVASMVPPGMSDWASEGVAFRWTFD
jgi:hypothetical protein